MTGGELVPLSKAAMRAISRASQDNPADEHLADLAANTPAMKAAADAYGRRQAVTQEIRLRLLRPLAWVLQVSPDYFEKEFVQDYDERTAHIPAEHLTSPRPSIALPVIEGLGYSLDEPDLKEMYLRLLATASDGRSPHAAHPAFAQIISQLSGAEAGMLLTCVKRDEMPLARLQRVDSSKPFGGFTVLRWHLLNLVDPETGNPADVPAFPIWVDNWARLGLVNVDYSLNISEPNAYDWVEDRPEFGWLREEIPDGTLLEVGRGVLHPTDFGRRFAEAVSAPGDPDDQGSDPSGSVPMN